MAWQLGNEASDPFVSRFVRGRKMASDQALFDEFSAALQFPDYFGENWNAFYECIGDLDWLRGNMVLIIITDADRVLEEEGQERIKKFFCSLGATADKFSKGRIDRSPPEPDPSIAFHVICHVPRSEIGTFGTALEEFGLAYDVLK